MSARAGRGGRPGRAPRTTVRTAAALPGWAVRLVVVLTVPAAGTAVAGSTAQWLVIGALALLLGLNPNGALVPLGLGVLAAMLAVQGSTAWWTLPVLLLTGHALLVLGAVAALTSWRGRVELRVVADLLPRFFAVQLVAQVAGAGARVLRGAAPVPWLVVGAVAALGLLAAVVLHQLSRRPPPASRARGPGLSLAGPGDRPPPAAGRRRARGGRGTPGRD